MLTKKDLAAIEELIDRRLEEKLEEKFEEKLKYLPTKNEFYTKMDEVMGELKSMREEFTLTVPKISGYEERISTLEEIHPEGKHASI